METYTMYLHEEPHNETTYLSSFILQTQSTSKWLEGEGREREQGER